MKTNRARNWMIAAAAFAIAGGIGLPPANAQEETNPAVAPAAAGPVVKPIDGFESDQNLLRCKSGQYQQDPSRIFAARTAESCHTGNKALKIRYDKRGAGGPSDNGGWCGYWTLLKNGSHYFDVSSCKALTFWVRGENGGEIFRIGVADMHWDQLQDSVKSGDVTEYLSSGLVTKDWQKVEIPLDTWFVDLKQLASLAICFESDNYPDGKQASTIYIDDLQFE